MSTLLRMQLKCIFLLYITCVAIIDASNSTSTKQQAISSSSSELLLPCECGTTAISSRIFGGRSVSSSAKFPWMAAIVDNIGNQVFCTGSLINNRYVLTAAHCLINRDESMIHIVLGESDITSPASSSLYRVNRLYSHPSFSGVSTMQNDIALIELDRTVVFSERMKPICLPKAGPRYFGTFTIAGWGLLSPAGRQPRVLQEARVLQRSQTYCQAVYGSSKYSNKDHICANGPTSGVCNGDSGGPLMYSSAGKYFQVAIVSYGSSNCADTRFPAAFTRTSGYLEWIFSTTTSGKYCKG